MYVNIYYYLFISVQPTVICLLLQIIWHYFFLASKAAHFVWFICQPSNIRAAAAAAAMYTTYLVVVMYVSLYL